ncbi:MAG: FUSC family protein [Methylocystis sp.]
MLYSLLDWPGIHTCLITCYIVSLGTAAETIEKLTLRILGCLIGAASGIAAIVYIIPYTTSIGDLMTVVFVGAFASAWFAVGSPRIAYAGFQMAFAFFLCVIQGSGPSFDMVTARDRVIGILIGNIVVYLVFTNIWPVSIGKRVDVTLAALLRNFRDLLTVSSRLERDALAPQAQEMLASAEQDLDLALYEPPSVRHSDQWIGTYRRAAQEIGALFGPLLLTARAAPRFSAKIAARLDRIAVSLDADEKTATSSEIDGCVGSDSASNERVESEQPPFQNAIDRHLNNLEDAFGREGENNRKVNYASA